MADFKAVEEARKTLGLGESATFREIRESYRRLALKYHPDKCGENEKKECGEMFKKINRANETLMAYCANYRFSFSKEKADETGMDKETAEHLKRFYDGWWGNLDL